MKLIAILLVALVAFSSVDARMFSEDEYQLLFNAFVHQHNKKYSDPDEFFRRYEIFRNNLDYVKTHMAKAERTHDLEMNQYGDMSNDEFRSMMNHYVAPLNGNANNTKVLPTTDLPTSVDWTTKGVVTPVKNQGQCGSCWAFSTTGSTESAHAIKTGTLISLSEQELVDCGGSTGNQGCNGGLMDQGFQWIINNGGIATEKCYPYTAQDGTCNTSKCPNAVSISSYQDVTHNSPSQLTAAIAQQPVSIAVDAGGLDWQLYSGGVLSDACGTQLDHGVLAAGYGTDSSSGTDYYLVKNSWGASWGESGYIRLKRTSTQGPGECGIQLSPSYPIA
mmetsp:Transcript_15035/g.27155  ORF Transcript_15035/g.27155 Transcript_15035/m.27155 type:complete len:333 (+) Transcript_15035:77-1075(+)